MSSIEDEYLTVAEDQDISHLISAAQNTPSATLYYRTVGNQSHIQQTVKDDLFRLAIPVADLYAEICEQQGRDLASKFQKFKKEYAPLPENPNTNKEIWREHAIKITDKIRSDFKLGYELNANGTIVPKSGCTSLESFLDEIGIAFVMIPHCKQFHNIQGFATCFLGTPVIVLVETQVKDYRSMFYTVAHELFHLLYGEGEYIGNGPFSGTLLLGKTEYQQVYRQICSQITATADAKIFVNMLPQLLHKFPFYSISCLANTAHNYQLIDDKERKQWQKGHNTAWIYQELKKISPKIQPYQWQSKAMNFTGEDCPISEGLKQEYLEALNNIKG